MSVEFCDTNVVLYAYDTSAGVKHDRARLLLERLWSERIGVVSVQMLQELCLTLTRKLHGLSTRRPPALSSATLPPGASSSQLRSRCWRPSAARSHSGTH